MALFAERPRERLLCRKERLDEGVKSEHGVTWMQADYRALFGCGLRAVGTGHTVYKMRMELEEYIGVVGVLQGKVFAIGKGRSGFFTSASVRDNKQQLVNSHHAELIH